MAGSNRQTSSDPLSILEREFQKFIKEKVETNRAIGELEHPQSPTVDTRKASHRIVEMRKEGNDWIGKALILNTPMGDIARGLVEGGTSIGVSTRGMGDVHNKRGVNVIAENFNLVTVDIVGSPSGPDCYVNGIMESVEWTLDEKGIFKPEDRQRVFESAKTELSGRQKIREISKFLEKI